MEAILEAQNLKKQFKEKLALNELNLKLNSGEIFCMLGQNGAGKSTTINLFLGFLQPTSGKALIKGLEVSKHPEDIKKYLAYIPEQVMLYPNLTGLENLSLFTSLSGFKYTKKELTEYLINAGLPKNAILHKIGSYSKGMRQKVGIAIAVAKKAELLLLDEPTSGLDPKASNEFINLLLRLKSEGTSIFMATHDIFRAKQVADRIGIMREGNLIDLIDTTSLDANELEKRYLNYMYTP